MISRHDIGSAGDAARYHDKAFSHDGVLKADNYYLHEQSAAQWHGKGAELIGWAGQPVTRDQFVDALEGRLPNPATGAVQDLSTASRERRAGMDLTISPSKSISIVALVGKDERVTEAHTQANARAMAWLERNASVIRVRENGGAPMARLAGNLLYATVVHETDRANQPQLHSHNVLAAVVYDKDAGQWRSLTNDTLLELRAKADIVYKAELARALRAAGYALDYRDNGIDFEIRGVEQHHIDAYATRGAQIKQALIAHGIDPETASYDARQAATLDSRARKQEVPRDVLHEFWQATAREVNLDLGALVSTARARSVDVDRDQVARQERSAAMQAVTWAVAHLSEREQAFKRTDLEIETLKFNRKLSTDAVEWAINKQSANGQLMPRGEGGQAAVLLTTPKALTIERALLADIAAGKGESNVVLRDAAAFEAAVQAFQERKTKESGVEFKLSAEQLNAARNVLMHTDSYQGIQGDAGTGKTVALAMVREVAEGRGWNVTGMATSSSAAKELQEASGVQSQTVASFFVDRVNAIRLTKTEIAELQAELARRHAPPAGEPLRAERIKLNVEAGEVRFGEAHYVFDHKKEAVFRAATGLAGLVGNFLMDTADALRERATKANSMEGHLRASALQWGAGAADHLGQQLAHFERVGFVEGAMARSALYLERAPQPDALQRSLALKAAELHNLERTGNRDGKKTLLVMDEASLTGAADTAKVSALARSIGARVIFQGDIKQHGSVAAGRAFWLSQRAGMQTSVLEETRRFDKATNQVKDALKDMKRQQFAAALARLDKAVVAQGDLPHKVAQRYVTNLTELEAASVTAPKVGIVALTNADRKNINAAVHAALTASGLVDPRGHAKAHLDDPKLTSAERANAGRLRAAGVDRLVFRQRYRELGVEKYELVRVVGFDLERNRVQIERADGGRAWLNPQKQERFSPAKAETREFSAGDLVEARGNLRMHDTGTDQVKSGSRGVMLAVDGKGATVRWSDGRETTLTNEHLQFVDHGYARTSFKEQGATNHREILAVSATGAKIINREASYVATTRAKDNTEIVTSDPDRMLKSAGKDVSKLTALETGQSLDEIVARYRETLREPNRSPAKQRELEQVRQRDLGWTL